MYTLSMYTLSMYTLSMYILSMADRVQCLIYVRLIHNKTKRKERKKNLI